MDTESPIISVIGDVARDVHVRIRGQVPNDLVVAGDTPAQIHMLPGGSAATTAAWLAHAGVLVRFIGARGDDHLGAVAETDLLRWGVEPRLQVVSEAPTGTVVVLVDSQGERSMFPDPGANLHLDPEWCTEHVGGRHLHVSAYTWYRPETRACVEESIARAHQRSMSVSVDLNSYSLVREHAQALMDLVADVDVVFANEEEFAALGTAWKPPASVTTVVKLGARGARWIAAGGSGLSPAAPGPVVDSVGAGDAFAAGFLSVWLATGAPDEATATGNALAHACVTRVGPGPAFRD